MSRLFKCKRKKHLRIDSITSGLLSIMGLSIAIDLFRTRKRDNISDVVVPISLLLLGAHLGLKSLSKFNSTKSASTSPFEKNKKSGTDELNPTKSAATYKNKKSGPKEITWKTR